MQPIIDVDAADGDDNSIDDTQLKEFQEELETLSAFPNKITINFLSMVAEDYASNASSSEKIYRVIRRRLLGCGSASYILPVIYVLDSILKNAMGCFIKLVENDAASWFSTVFGRLSNEQQPKFQKVWKMWNDAKIFDEEKLKQMGTCFKSTGLSSTFPPVDGIARTNDGKLIMSSSLRKSMQSILDEVQNSVSNELDKVSLERLATIDKDLFSKIKQAAMSEKSESSLLFTTNKAVPESSWSTVKLDPEGVVDSIRSITNNLHNELYEKSDALKMTRYLSMATVAAHWLDNAATHAAMVSKQLAEQEQTTVGASASAGFLVDAEDFTNEGVKKRNPAVIALLYEIGLPFVSSADGKRFRTQLELSNHLDDLFKKKQIQKVMAATQERGWYMTERVWTNEESPRQQLDQALSVSMNEATKDEPAEEAEDTTYPEDENRDHCVICGRRFKLIQKNDDYVYDNCREIIVLNDDAAATESDDVLVHISCWRGLGEPHELTFDQTLQS